LGVTALKIKDGDLACIRIKAKLFLHSDKRFPDRVSILAFTPSQLDLAQRAQRVWTLSGWLQTQSTSAHHTHGFHQILTIKEGVSLLVDETQKQPLFGTMTAFIPAHLPHRSIVIGDPVTYKSIYLAPALMAPLGSEILIFNISVLGGALVDRIDIHQPTDLSLGLNRECLELLLKILPEDMARPAHLVRLPEPSQPLTRGVIAFIETHYARRLTMSDFAVAFPYSGRHLSRRFKADLSITIFEYLRLYRILMASMALCNRHRTITEIAFGCGYESLSSFYRDFNLIYAVPPKTFRANLKPRG
jgi:AraC-like DNA-binding protein